MQNRVKGIVGSMDNLPFEKESLDLIWSEGAIYNIGFERGINEWRDYLKPNGYIAVSESSWFTEKRPAEIHDFWMQGYQEIDTIPVKVAQMQRAGYLPVASFVLPEKCWTEHYYQPLSEDVYKRQAVCLPHRISHKQGTRAEIDDTEQTQMPETGLDVF